MNIGEIIETSTGHFVAQVYEPESTPPLGSFVQSKAGTDTVTGVVVEIVSTTLDSSRRPMALGDAKSTLADTLANYPQLSKLIHTYFKVLITHVDERSTVPSTPPQLHEGVVIVSKSDAVKLLGSFDYLNRLLEESNDVLSKHLQYISSIDEKSLSPASEKVGSMLKVDYTRLKNVLSTVGSGK